MDWRREQLYLFGTFWSTSPTLVLSNDTSGKHSSAAKCVFILFGGSSVVFMSYKAELLNVWGILFDEEYDSIVFMSIYSVCASQISSKLCLSRAGRLVFPAWPELYPPWGLQGHNGCEDFEKPIAACILLLMQGTSFSLLIFHRSLFPGVDSSWLKKIRSLTVGSD